MILNDLTFNENVKTKEEILADYQSEIRQLEAKARHCTSDIQLLKHNRKCYRNRIEKLKETMKLYE